MLSFPVAAQIDGSRVGSGIQGLRLEQDPGRGGTLLPSRHVLAAWGWGLDPAAVPTWNVLWAFSGLERARCGEDLCSGSDPRHGAGSWEGLVPHRVLPQGELREERGILPK